MSSSPPVTSEVVGQSTPHSNLLRRKPEILSEYIKPSIQLTAAVKLDPVATPHELELPQLSGSFTRNSVSLAFQDFERTLTQFTVKPTHKGGREFVLIESLSNWLRSQWPDHTCSQADRLLKAVYYNHNQKGLFEPISVDQLLSKQNECLLVFSILLVLKRGFLVDRFQRHGIVDLQIPISLERLQTRIKEMELGELEPNKLASSFYEKQYLFCPLIIYRDMARNYDKEYIMPICQKQKINDKSGIATGIYLVEVQEQFVEKDLRTGAVRYQNIKDGFGYRYQFALKTFHQSNYELFANEVQAFKALKNHEGMVKYLGEYTHEDHRTSGSAASLDKTFNILLEYGDLDLDEYFLERLPPVLPSEIMRFWKDLFEVSEAIKGVHNLKHGEEEFAEDYYGWHADIKPDNILSVRGKFKLADPGFAHFIKKTDETPMGKVLGGTETFGAPECHPSRRRTSTAFHQTIDIWSLGCVFSIAATWVALGYQGVLQYAEFRKNALKDYKQQNLSELVRVASDENTSDDQKSIEDCFHDGYDVLPEITEWHKSLRTMLRKTDTLTSLVLNLIDDKMLLSDPTKRISAEETCVELDRIYKETEEAQTRLGKQIPEVITAALRQLDDSAPAKALPKTPSEESSPDLHSRTAISKCLEVPLMKTTHRSELFKPEPHRISQQLGGILESEVPAKAEAQRDVLQNLGIQAVGLKFPQYAVSAHSQPYINQPAATLYSIATNSGRSTSSKTPRGSPALPSKNLSNSSKYRTPRQNAFEARQQLDQHSKGALAFTRKLIGKQKKDVVLRNYFRNRDLLFLVDNGATMKQHWSQATFLLETLVMKAHGQDPDGPDLMFTLGQRRLKGTKNALAFKAAMEDPEAMPTDEVTDIRTSFGDIFVEHIKNLEKAKTRHFISPVKQLTIIVLTDGVWGGTLAREDVNKQIVTFVRSVRELSNNLIYRHVSIEFVQFGKDPTATMHLRILDDMLTDAGVPDVIDTEPSDGDVYKMLLGSFVDNYDEDEMRLELVESPPGTQESMYNMPYSNHASPSHDGAYAPPTRTATGVTEMSQQTMRPAGPSDWQNHYPTYP
ncbi:kinase-like protein [Stipitochalara longipes BDJ]|nr:kinase-like protein [Stipitochalara longipes BDJ]